MPENHELVYKDYIVPQEYKTNDPRGQGWYLDKEVKSKHSRRTSYSYRADGTDNNLISERVINYFTYTGSSRFYNSPYIRGTIDFISVKNKNDVWIKLKTYNITDDGTTSYIPPGGSCNMLLSGPNKFLLSIAESPIPSTIHWEGIYVKSVIDISGPGGGEN